MTSVRDLGRGNVIDVKCKDRPGVDVLVKGSRNTVTVEDFPLSELRIKVSGNDNTITIGKLHHVNKLRITAKNRASVSIGDLTSAQDLYIVADEAAVTIGRDCMISFGVSIRTTDAHGMYELETGELLNKPGDVTIADHVWIGQGAIVSRSTVIGPDCVIGAKSYVQKINVPANSVAAGTPARIVRRGVTWDRQIVPNIKTNHNRIMAGLRRWLGK